MSDDGKLKLTLVQWNTGKGSVYLNDYRIAGSKPWGGGWVTREWFVDPKDIERALSHKEANP